MIRTFKRRLYPTQMQNTVLDTLLCRLGGLYNGCLQERKTAYVHFAPKDRNDPTEPKDPRRFISYNDQTKSLTEIRAVDPAWEAIRVDVARSALRRCQRAFDAFRRRVKAGAKNPGYPRFKSSRRYKSFTFGIASSNPVSLRFSDHRVLVPGIGWVKFKKERPILGKVLTATVSREPTGRWWICFTCDVGAVPAKVDVATVPVERIVGLDVGLRALVTLSTGGSVDHPRYAAEAAATLARRQRAVARRKKGSRSRRRAVKLVARAHEHVRNQRLDHARKIAAWLVSRFDVISFEDLHIGQMARGNLAFSIHDAGWRVLLAAIASKAEWAGKYAVAVDPRGTSQRCSGCGATVRKDLSVRVHRCPHCGLVLDRDHNASLNIRALGWSAVSKPGAVGPARPEDSEAI